MKLPSSAFLGFLGFLGFCLPASPQSLPITRLASVGFSVSDLAKAREFYTGVMGFEEAFELNSCVFFRVNDDQYLQFCPGLAGSGNFSLDRIVLLTPSIQLLHRLLTGEKLEPSALRRQNDGNLHFAVADRDGMPVEFVQYLPGSPQMAPRRKSLEARPISDHLLHVGLAMSSEAAGMAFYSGKLGFREFLRGGPNPPEIRWINMMMPGTYGDYVELMVQTSAPASARQHLCFEIQDAQVTYKQLQERKAPGQFKPFLAQNNRWIINFRDLYGIRVELMEGKEAKSK